MSIKIDGARPKNKNYRGKYGISKKQYSYE